MSETYADDMYARGHQENTTAGGVILMVVGFVATILLIAGLIYAMGDHVRNRAALALNACGPSQSPSGLPCNTQQMVLSQYEGIVTPVGKLLNADMVAYRANERRNL